MPDWTAPVDGWIVVSVGGERLTSCEVQADEDIEIELLTDDD